MSDLSDMGFFAGGLVDFSVAVVRGQVKLGPKTKKKNICSFSKSLKK